VLSRPGPARAGDGLSGPGRSEVPGPPGPGPARRVRPAGGGGWTGTEGGLSGAGNYARVRVQLCRSFLSSPGAGAARVWQCCILGPAAGTGRQGDTALSLPSGSELRPGRRATGTRALLLAVARGPGLGQWAIAGQCGLSNH
jgi:hypothetical protein